MKFNTLLRQALSDTNTTQSALARELGTRQSTIGNALARPDIYVSTLIRILDTLGYDIQVTHRQTGVTYDLTEDDETCTTR